MEKVVCRITFDSLVRYMIPKVLKVHPSGACPRITTLSLLFILFVSHFQVLPMESLCLPIFPLSAQLSYPSRFGISLQGLCAGLAFVAASGLCKPSGPDIPLSTLPSLPSIPALSLLLALAFV